MKQINEQNCKKFRDSSVKERLTDLNFMTHCLQNRTYQKNQIPLKTFFVLLVVIYCSYAGVDAYAGNDAAYNIPSQKVSNQVIGKISVSTNMTHYPLEPA